ncbi:MAG: CynX/NimT family MFS transporter [Granulosicoccus sp.]
MLFILFLVRLSMGYQFQSVASTSEQLINDFGLSYAQIGTLIGFFLLPGVFFSIPSGAVTRAVPDKKLLILGAFTMVVGAAVMGLAVDGFSLFAGRLITGLGGTIFNVILTKMVTDWFVKKEIVFALSVMLTAWPVGIALGLLTHALISDTYGWNGVMFATAIFSFIAMLVTASLYQAPIKSGIQIDEPLRFGLPSRQLVHMSVVGLAWTLYNACLIVVVSFAPAVFIAAGYEAGAAHSVTSLFMWAMMISLPLGGRIMGSFETVTPAVVSALLIASVLVVALAFGVLPALSTVLFGLFAGIPGGALMSLSAQAVSSSNRGPGLGIFYTWYYVGMTLAPAVAGGLRDWSGSSQIPVLFAALMLIGVVFLVILFRVLQKRWPIDKYRHGVVS